MLLSVFSSLTEHPGLEFQRGYKAISDATREYAARDIGPLELSDA